MGRSPCALLAACAHLLLAFGVAQVLVLQRRQNLIRGAAQHVLDKQTAHTSHGLPASAVSAGLQPQRARDPYLWLLAKERVDDGQQRLISLARLLSARPVQRALRVRMRTAARVPP